MNKNKERKTITATYYFSNVIKNTLILFGNKEEAENFDNVITDCVTKPEAIEELKSLPYNTVQEIKDAIENGDILEEINGNYGVKLIDACEDSVSKYDNYFTFNEDCYLIPLKYVFGKIYNVEL